MCNIGNDVSTTDLILDTDTSEFIIESYQRIVHTAGPAYELAIPTPGADNDETPIEKLIINEIAPAGATSAACDGS